MGGGGTTQGAPERCGQIRRERIFRDVVESSPVGMLFYAIDSHDQLVFDGANPSAGAILGVEIQTFVGLPVEEAFPSLDKPELPERLRRAAVEGEPWHTDQMTFEYEPISGIYELFAFQTRPGAVVAMIFDVTARREAEARAEQQRRDISFINRTAMDLVALDLDDDIHNCIARHLHDFVGGSSVVVIIENEPETGRRHIRAWRGLSNVAEEGLRRALAVTATETEEAIPGQHDMSTTNSSARPLEGGLAKFLEALLPGDVVEMITSEHDCQAVHVVDFTRLGSLLASAAIIQGLDDPTPRYEVVDAFARLVANALERRRALQEVTQRNWELAILNTLAVTEGDFLDVSSYLDRAARDVAGFIGLGASIWLVEGAQDRDLRKGLQCRLAACRGHTRDWQTFAQKVTTMRELLPEGEQPGRLLLVGVPNNLPEELRRCTRRDGIETCLFVPLETGANSLGYLLLSATPTSERVLSRQGFFRTLGNQIGMVLHNVQLFEEVDTHRKRLRHLADDLTNTEEKQRRKTALDVHDRVGQPLSIARALLSADQTMNGKSNECLDKAMECMGTALAGIRSIILDLHPPVLDSFGIGATIEDAAREIMDVADLDIETKIEYREMRESSWLRSFLLRAAKELMVNVVKHADATRVIVTLSVRAEHLVLQVEDDGKGFDTARINGANTAPKGFSLISLEERSINFGGTYRIRSIPNKGTQVEISLPLRNRHSEPALR